MATKYYEIPTSPKAQRFFITLAGVQYLMRLVWRSGVMGGWVLDISTAAGVPLVMGIPLVTGVDLLEPYPEKKFGGRLYVMTDGAPDQPPTYENLGTEGHLYFGVPA